MPNHHWHDRLYEELARRGVPARYRRRLLAELRHHAEEIENEEVGTMSDERMESRLGRPAVLAALAAEEYRRARFASRHPLLVFGLLPLPATLLAITATLLAFGLAGHCGAWLTAAEVDDLPRPALVALAYAASWGVRFVPFVVLAVAFTRAYLRSRVSGWWFAVAAAQVLVVAGSLISLIRFSDEPGQSSWMLGLACVPIPAGDTWALPLFSHIGWMQAVQVIVPLVVGLLTARVVPNRARYSVRTN